MRTKLCLICYACRHLRKHQKLRHSSCKQQCLNCSSSFGKLCHTGLHAY